MKTRILTAASALAIMAAAPAFADNVNTTTTTNAEVERMQNQNDDAVVTQEEMKQGWEDTKAAVSDAAGDVADATKNTYEDVKAVFISNDENAETSDITINERNLASNIIGSTVYNSQGESIAKIHDIILTQDGQASMVVLADGEIFGLGKQVAFDYSELMSPNADGEITVPLTEEAIDRAAEFSYETESDNTDVRVMPANGYSVAELMGDHVVDQKGEHIASIEDVSFNGMEADNLVVGFNKILGLGGDRAALAFDDTTMVRNTDGDGYNFQLSATQSNQFENYKKRF